MLQLMELLSMDNSREECLPQTAVAKISAHAAGKGYPRLTFAGSVADADLCKGAGLAEGKSGSKWLRSSTRRGAAGAAQAARAPVGFSFFSYGCIVCIFALQYALHSLFGWGCYNIL